MSGLSADASFIRIYNNIIQIQNPMTKSHMIQTCMQDHRMIMAAKHAGVYSHLLSYITAIKEGYTPRPLPGEQIQIAQTVHVVPRSVAGQSWMSQADAIATGKSTSKAVALEAALAAGKSTSKAVALEAALAAGGGRPSPPQVKGDYAIKSTAMTHYQEKESGKGWQQIMQTPKQKVVSYFSSCLEVLGIQEEVAITEEILKKSYKKSALRAHPDKGGTEEEFEAITRAYAYLSEILKRMQGGRDISGRVEAPSALSTGRQTEAKKWEYTEPVKLNPKNLDMNAFNRMFEETHMPDPDQDGYGDWLKTAEGSAGSSGPKFGGKFNRDVFNNMFEEEAKKSSKNQSTALIMHPEAMALGPTMGIEIGRDRPEDYTAAPNSKQHFTDLRAAYTTESTISDKVAGIRVEERKLETYRASREKAPDPYTSAERMQLSQSEMMLKQREEMRQRRVAERSVVENDYFERMKRLVITDK